jgi:Domain of unknown function DUF29
MRTTKHQPEAEHLLKLAFAPQPVGEKNRRVWMLTVKEARRKINRLLTESSGLKSALQALFEEAWLDGRDEALKFLDSHEDAIAEVPLWSFEQTMAVNFFPVQ